MAEAGHPGLELHPLGEDVTLETTLSAHSLLGPSLQTKTSCRQPGGPGDTFQEKPQEVPHQVCEDELASLPAGGTKQGSVRVTSEPREKDKAEPCRSFGAPSLYHSPAKIQTASHQHCKALSENCQADRTVQSINLTPLPVHGSHSVTSPMIRQAPPPQTDHEACGLFHQRGGNCIETDIHSPLLCKCPMELQQSSIISELSGEGGVPQPQNRCVCILPPHTAGRVEGPTEGGTLSAKCDTAHCCGSYINHANFEDTFAAYCHPQPIPAPSQLLLNSLPGAEPSCDLQRASVEPPAAINHLTLPRLISSVSETGLDAKHLLRCCNLSCSWMNSLPPAGPQAQKHFGLEENCSSSTGLFRIATRDMGTMTANKELRDVGVQTGPSVTPHVFPEICLAEESRSELPDSSDGDKKAGGAPKSPVKEVKWDAEGMTWEVYGASVDPEELGLAIQRHLELQIKETAKHAAKLSRQNTNTSHQSRKNSCQRKRSRMMMGSFRTPACCACTTAAVD